MSPDLRLTFVVESGTDVRLVDGLKKHFILDLICRRIPRGFPVNWAPNPETKIVIGPAGRLSFATFLGWSLATRAYSPDLVLVQGYAAAALVVNVLAKVRGSFPVMLVCSPVEAYYQCRRAAGDSTTPFRLRELLGLRILARLNAALGQQYVVLSRSLADVVSDHGASGPIDIVPLYGVDVHRFTPSHESKMALRARLRLPMTGSVVFFSSRIAPEKDADTVLHAIGELNKSGRKVWLVNRSGGHESFLSRAHTLGVGAHVVTGGPVHPRLELPPFYQAADVCVQASREEGLGFSPLEALACGTPVIATAVGGLRETIIDGQTGWSYPRGDPARLASALAEVLDSPQEAARRTRAGRQMVLECFEEGKVFSDFERVMRAVVSSRTSGRRPEAGNHTSRSEPDP